MTFCPSPILKVLLPLVVIHVASVCRAQQADVESEPPPIDNSQFFDVTHKARITRRFEIYDPHSRGELEAVKAMGFDQVILDRAPLHVEATDVGLDVVIANWWNHETLPDTIEQSLRVAREVAPGRLAGISVMDEPERNSPDTPFSYYVDLYQELLPRMVDELSGVRLEIAYWGPLRWWDQRYYDYFSYLYEAADVMRIMPYPDLHEDPLSEVYLMLQRSRRAMRIADREIPHVVILQTWVLPPENKLPTIDELRVMAYQAMLGGAETISFFEYRPELWQETVGFTEGFKALMAELRGLSERLADAEIESQLSENGILQATATWPSGRVEQVRINTNRFAQSGMSELEIQDSSLEPPRLAGPRIEQAEASTSAMRRTGDCACRSYLAMESRLPHCLPPAGGCSQTFTRQRPLCCPSATTCVPSQRPISSNRRPRRFLILRR